MCSTFSLAAKAYMRDSNGKFPPRKYMVIATKRSTPKQIISMPVFPELSIQVIPSVADLQVQDIIQRQSQTCKMAKEDGRRKPGLDLSFVEESYERCRKICEEYAKTYYIGTLLMTEERRKALWAIYAWGRRTDELVDGPNSVHMSSDVLDMWEVRLQDIFEGRPHDIIDVALTHIVFSFSLDIKPFRDVIEGMRMDTRKFHYQNFQELYIYSYRVVGTFGLMSVPVLGIAPDSLISAQGVYEGAIHFGIANQLTNILRDVGEDAKLGRVYLPQDELAHFGLSDTDIFARKVTDQWREFMKEQIARARIYFNLAEEEASQLDKASRWPIWSALFMYRGIMDAIEDNGYDNLTKRAYVRRAKKLFMLPLAYKRSL